jgi:hypothetical protein
MAKAEKAVVGLIATNSSQMALHGCAPMNEVSPPTKKKDAGGKCID